MGDLFTVRQPIKTTPYNHQIYIIPIVCMYIQYTARLQNKSYILVTNNIHKTNSCNTRSSVITVTLL